MDNGHGRTHQNKNLQDKVLTCEDEHWTPDRGQPLAGLEPGARLGEGRVQVHCAAPDQRPRRAEGGDLVPHAAERGLQHQTRHRAKHGEVELKLR